MRRFIVPVVVMFLMLLIAGSASAAVVKIVVEAGDYFAISPSMAKVTAQYLGNNDYIHIPLRRPHATTQTGPGDTGNARYKINVPVAGTYRLWMRAWWYDACGNSFFIVVDDKPAVYAEAATYQSWHWVKGPSLTLSAGTHTIRIQTREDGARMDQFMLINSTQYVPTRIETRTAQYIVK